MDDAFLETQTSLSLPAVACVHLLSFEYNQLAHHQPSSSNADDYTQLHTATHSNTQAILYLIALESLFSTRSPVCRSRRIRPFAVLLTSCSIVAPGVLGELSSGSGEVN